MASSKECLDFVLEQLSDLDEITYYEKYKALPIDKALLCLEEGTITQPPYFCYPVNAEPIGFESCIMYCFLPIISARNFGVSKSRKL